MEKESVLRMAMGAIEERVDYEMSRVIDNILDPNTKANAKRTITLTLEVVPDSKRERLTLPAHAKTNPCPTAPVSTSLLIAPDRNGELTVRELVAQVPGQFDMDGKVQPESKLLKLVQAQ